MQDCLFRLMVLFLFVYSRIIPGVLFPSLGVGANQMVFYAKEPC